MNNSSVCQEKKEIQSPMQWYPFQQNKGFLTKLKSDDLEYSDPYFLLLQHKFNQLTAFPVCVLRFPASGTGSVGTPKATKAESPQHPPRSQQSRAAAPGFTCPPPLNTVMDTQNPVLFPSCKHCSFSPLSPLPATYPGLCSFRSNLFSGLGGQKQPGGTRHTISERFIWHPRGPVEKA